MKNLKTKNLNKRKILYVITKGNFGGAQRYVFDLATGLLSDDFEPVVALGKGWLLEKKLKEAGIRTIRLKNSQRNINPFKDLLLFFELLSLYKKEKPDIVHLNSSKIGFIGSLAARIYPLYPIPYTLNPKIIFTAHGWPFLERRNILARVIFWLFSWFTALLSHKVIVVSNYDLATSQKMPFIGKRTVRIYNGINLDMSFGSGDIIRQSFPQGVKITGTIGELNKNKNQKSLLEGARNNHNMYVAIVGEGEERSALEKKIKKYGLESRVKLFGFMPAEKVLKGFDYFALPSLKEGLPYVLIEARLAGLSIKANRVGGVSEILDAPDLRDFTLQKMVKKTVLVYSDSGV